MSRTQKLLLAAAIPLIIAAGAILSRPSAPEAPPPAAPIAQKETAARPVAPAQAPMATPTPQVKVELLPPSAGYVGSETCAECHDDEHAAWSQDWHARALTEATPRYVVGDSPTPTSRVSPARRGWPGGTSAPS
jgi:hypothetical protein